MGFDPEALLKSIREKDGTRSIPRPIRQGSTMFQSVDIVEKIRIKADESATSAMGQKWNHAFCVRLWPKADEAGTAEIVRWLQQNIEHGGWGIYKNDQRVIGIRDPNDAIAFKMRWR